MKKPRWKLDGVNLIEISYDSANWKICLLGLTFKKTHSDPEEQHFIYRPLFQIRDGFVHDIEFSIFFMGWEFDLPKWMKKKVIECNCGHGADVSGICGCKDL